MQENLELLEEMALEFLETKAGAKRLTEMVTRRKENLSDLRDKLTSLEEQIDMLEQALAENRRRKEEVEGPHEAAG